MDLVLGGLMIALGLAFVVIAVLHRTLDLFTIAVVLAGGCLLALFGLVIAARPLSHLADRRGTSSNCRRKERTDEL